MKQKRISRTAKGRRPTYFHDPATDKLMAIVLTLVGELSVTRERLDAIERLLDNKGCIARDDVDAFIPDNRAERERAEARANYIDRVMRIVTMELQKTDGDGATANFRVTLEAMLDSDEAG